ncbi:uncharacterized protein LOC129912543, partial [Episyrphus balteatus]|uniref:uncharacterized protein LOC129912543 n=1 Tax=Episyrphus balteatus TaxID=286459 RepID=UPI0024868371
LQILSLIAAAYARPDVSLGYSYNQVSDGSSGNEAILSAPQHNFQSSGGGLNHVAQAPIQRGSLQEPLISKQFFLHSAPEDNEIQQKHFVLGRPQKNYRVVFIKAPSASNVKLSAEYAPIEEKTQIFVLSQKEAELDVNNIATPAPTQPSKPEVFFVKYRTPEEAQHAQQKIQEQYDALGGSSQVSDEGTAPVSSVIGALGGDNGELSQSSSNQQSVAAAGLAYLPPASSYLPPGRRH